MHFNRKSAGFSLAAIVAVAVAVTVSLTLSAAPHYRPAAGDDCAPTEPRYLHALQLGLAKEYAGAGREMAGLAQARQGTSTGAWALYQASLAASAQGRTAEAVALEGELRREYAEHPLTARLAAAIAPAAPPRRAVGDCGPRSLLRLCTEAGVSASLPELTRQCGTDKHGTTLDGLLRAARRRGLKAEAAQVDEWFLRRHRPSGVAWVDGDHYVAFFPGGHDGEVRVLDPNVAGERVTPVAELARRSGGVVLLAAWGGRELPRIAALAPTRPTVGKEGQPAPM
ncbi:MAG TPA: cysteine peptidase family C39 domain-containing protein [Armatimonadota bacterium]|nr:cysteine peptidase family C39 domain-containing protein [Armatimonadota bacterium]